MGDDGRKPSDARRRAGAIHFGEDAVGAAARALSIGALPTDEAKPLVGRIDLLALSWKSRFPWGPDMLEEDMSELRNITAPDLKITLPASMIRRAHAVRRAYRGPLLRCTTRVSVSGNGLLAGVEKSCSVRVRLVIARPRSAPPRPGRWRTRRTSARRSARQRPLSARRWARCQRSGEIQTFVRSSHSPRCQPGAGDWTSGAPPGRITIAARNRLGGTVAIRP